MMVVITMSCCPQKLRGDLTRWMIEIDTGVYVGNLNARIRDSVWERVCKNLNGGHAAMAFSANNEQKLDFRVYNTDREPIDLDGIKLMRKNRDSAADDDYIKKSKAAARHMARLSQKKKGSSAYPEEYVVVDIETTGLTENDEIIEIAALKIKDGEVEKAFSSLVKCKKEIPEEIAKLTGITNTELEKNGKGIKDVLLEFLTFCDCKNLVGHSIGFDLLFINRACRENGLSVMPMRTFDTMKLSRKKLDLGSYSLSAVAEELGIKVERAHRALDDCQTAYGIFEKLNEN